MKHLAMDFIHVTEAAALASLPWVGRGKKHEADDAATTAMRRKLNEIQMDAVIVIGEGEMDEAPMLYIGEKVGVGLGPRLDIAVDPLEGTILTANGQGNSITVIAVAPQGTLLHAPDIYMEKIAVGPRAAGKIDIEAPLLENMKVVAEANGKKLSELTVMIQDRERHMERIHFIREAGCRVQLFQDGDVTCTIAASMEGTGIDMFLGIGGAPEGVVSAVALKCLGGEMQGKLLPQSEEECNRCVQMGIPVPAKPLRMNQLVATEECMFAATAITNNLLLRGIRQERADRYTTHSLLTIGNAKRVHFIESVHHNPFEKQA